VSPGAVPTDYDFKSVPRGKDDGGNDTGEAGRGKGSGQDEEEEVAAHRSGARKSDKSTKGNIIFLTLDNDEYKRKITATCELLWGKEPESTNCKELAQRLYDNWSAEGKQFRRSLTGGRTKDKSFFEPTEEDAVQKIKNDLQRGKYDCKESVHFRGKRSPDKGSRDMEEDDTSPSQTKSPDGSTKMQSPPATPTNKDFVLSLLEKRPKSTKRYRKFIDKCLKNPELLNGEYHLTYDELTSRRLRKVTESGGIIFKIVNPGMRHVKVDDEEAAKKIMIGHLREKLTHARKNQDDIYIISMKYDDYKDKITEGANILLKKDDILSISIGSGEIGATLLEKLERSGAKYFFTSSGDERRLSHDDALTKITKDVREKARELRSRNTNSQSVVSSGTNGDTPLSSTRKKRNSSRNAQGMNAREYIADYVRVILPDHGWVVKYKRINELDVLVATRESGSDNNREGPNKLTGFDEIIDEAFVSGFYEKHIVGTENGREWLEQAGILEDPYSIFDDDLKCRRKRRKHNQDGADLVNTEICKNVPMMKKDTACSDDSNLDEDTETTDMAVSASDKTHGTF